MSDDDLPITEEWLKLAGFEQTKPDHVHGTPNSNWWNGSIEIWRFNDTDEWLWIEYDRVSMRTRGDLNLLMKWLGIRKPPTAPDCIKVQEVIE